MAFFVLDSNLKEMFSTTVSVPVLSFISLMPMHALK